MQSTKNRNRLLNPTLLLQELPTLHLPIPPLPQRHGLEPMLKHYVSSCSKIAPLVKLSAKQLSRPHLPQRLVPRRQPVFILIARVGSPWVLLLRRWTKLVLLLALASSVL